jgi:hypothetical protein
MKHTKIFFLEQVKERDHRQDVDIDGTIILKLILNKNVLVWTGFIWLWIGISGMLCSVNAIN